MGKKWLIMVSVNANIASLLAQNNTRQVNNELEKAMERLSSGLRINSAGDDATGLAIASRMEAQARVLQAATSMLAQANQSKQSILALLQ